jgi:hypothetical protein
MNDTEAEVEAIHARLNACPQIGSLTTPCNFIPLYSDTPTASTDEVISKTFENDSWTEVAEALSQTRARGVSHMACTRCGKSVPVEN